MSKLDWKMLVDQRNDWTQKNFPPYDGEIPGNDSVLGCIEELGELAHAHLKNKQGIRGTPEEHEVAAKDAIGDLVIYLLGVINAHMSPNDVGLPRSARQFVNAEQILFSISSGVGWMASCAGAQTPGLHWKLTINNILWFLEQYCTYNYWDFDGIVMDTASHVFKRDWNKHREDGATKDDPAMKDPRPLQGGGDPSVPFL